MRLVNADAEGTGEIEARGASVFAGYQGEPEATARAFTTDGWFRTGDFGRIDRQGYLTIVARVAETIVLADGKKLYPEPIEAVYAEHRLIKEVALFARQGALVALVVPDLDVFREMGRRGMRESIRDALSEQGKRLPATRGLRALAIARDKLPRTQLGKIQAPYRQGPVRGGARGVSDAGPAGELSAEDKALLGEPASRRHMAVSARPLRAAQLALDMSPQLDLGIDSLAWVDFTMAL